MQVSRRRLAKQRNLRLQLRVTRLWRGVLGLLISLWGLPNPPIGDLNGDNMVGGADLGLLLFYWNPCRP